MGNKGGAAALVPHPCLLRPLVFPNARLTDEVGQEVRNLNNCRFDFENEVKKFLKSFQNC
jgi:hypothetical protein